MMIGVTLGPALTIPLVLPLLGGSWRHDLLVVGGAGIDRGAGLCRLRAACTAATAQNGAPKRWWPDWNSPQLWLLGITLGANNALFYAANAFMPDYLTITGRGDLIGMTLGWLNGSQLAASFFMLAMAKACSDKAGRSRSSAR